MSHYGTFLCKTLDMFSLTAEVRLWDKQWEVGILHTSLLEHSVKHALHLFPDSIAVRLDHHTATHSRLLCEVGLYNQVVIPLRVVLGTAGHFFQFFCHILL